MPKAPGYFEPFAGAGFACSSPPPDPNGVVGYELTSTEQTGVIILAMDDRGKGVGS